MPRRPLAVTVTRARGDRPPRPYRMLTPLLHPPADDDDDDDDDDDHDENIFEEFLAVRMDLTKIFLKGF